MTPKFINRKFQKSFKKHVRAAAAAISAARASTARRNDFSLGSLEPRRLMSAVIEGTQGDDVFIIRVEDDNIIHLNFNGGVEVVNAPSDGFVSVSGYGGNDKFILLNTGNVRFTLIGFEGDDQYTIGQGNLAADLRRDVVISENVTTWPGNDSVVIDDSLGNGTLFRVDDRQISVSSVYQPVINCQMSAQGDTVRLVGSQGNDVVEVRKMMQNLHIDLGDGNDTVDFGGPDHIVEPSFHSGSSIDPGSGDNLMIIDDSSGDSDRTSINIKQVSTTVGQPRWMVLDNIGVTSSFQRLRIKTHALPDNQPEVVTFSGRDCPAHKVQVIGNPGVDKVLIGSQADPIWAAELYTSEIALTLDGGENNVEVNESSQALGHSWNVFEDHIVAGIMTIKYQPPIAGSLGVVNMLVRGTRFNDTFNIVETSLPWNITLAGGAGDDTLKQAPLLMPVGGKYDLDDNFVGYIKFDGGADSDSVILSDLDDELGDADKYHITRNNIAKANFDEDFFDSMLEMSFVDRLTFYCDDDTNNIEFDLGGFALAEIFAGGGDDRFINNSANVIPSNVFVNSLPSLARFYGGEGNDKLQLDDGSGGAGDYDLGSNLFQYTRDNITRAVEFDSFSHIDVNGSNQANTATLRGKPQGATLSFFVNGGDDTLIVGGGDIDASGLHNATLLGGAGNDKIVFDDSLDDHASFDADVLTLDFQKVTKDGVSILYGAFESQKVITSGVMNGPLAFANTVRVHGIDMPTEICDSPGQRWTEVQVGNGPFGLTQVAAPLKLTSVDSMEVTVFDTISTFDKQFVVGATTIRQNNSGANLSIEHNGLGTINIIAGGSNDQLIVESVAAGSTVFFNGGAGNDLVSVGNGTFANIHGNVHFSGGAGTDRIQFSNLFDGATDLITGRLTNSSFSITGGPLHQFFGGVEQVMLNIVSFGGTDIVIENSTQATTILAGIGDDRVTVKNLIGHLTFDGGAETSGDSILIDDSATTTPDRYTFAAGNVMQKNTGGPTLALNRVENVELRAGDGHNQVHVESAPFNLKVFTNGGNDSIVVTHSISDVLIHTGSEVANAPGAALGDSFSVANGASVAIDQDDAVILFQVNTGAKLSLKDNAVLCKTVPQGVFPLPQLLKGTIDLGGGALLYRFEEVNNPFRQWITAGRNGGAWNGTSSTGAINSSLAATSPALDGVGYGNGAQLGLTTVGSFTINPADTLIRHALAGDADLSGTVDIADFSRVAAKFNSTSPAWTDGDFNYDGVTDIGDFSALAANFNSGTQIAARVPAARGAMVDEPGEIASLLE